MQRVTTNIDAAVLEQLEAMRHQEGGALGSLVSRLLAEAISRRRTAPRPARIDWISRPMRARIELADKEALYQALDEGG